MLAMATVIAAAVVIFEAPPPFRSIAVLFFLGFGPGLSLVSLIGIKDVTQYLVLSIGISLAIDIIIAGLSVYAGSWSPLGILLILVAITLVGSGLQLFVAAGRHGVITPPTRTCDAQQDLARGKTTPAEVDRIVPLVSFYAGEAPIPATGNAPTLTVPMNLNVNRTGPRESDNPTPPARLSRGLLVFSFVGACIMLVAMGARRTFQA